MSENHRLPNDIFSFELQVHEKLEELHWKTEALRDVKKELAAVHQQLGEQQLLLEDERRNIKELQRQLHTAVEISHLLEKENTTHRSERHQLQINYDLILRERDSLLEQTRDLKIHNNTMKQEIQELKNVENANSVKYKNMDQMFHQLKNEMMQNLNSAMSNLLKLGKEQDNLRKSVEGVTCFNKRLQNVALSMQAHYKVQENQIQNLQRKLASTTCIKPPILDYITLCEPQLNSELIINELKTHQEDLAEQLKNVLLELNGLSNEEQC